jgi:hypothetical protein
MTATAISVRLPVSAGSSLKTLPSPAMLVGGVATFFRSRWVYQTTLAKLEGYSERTLRDIGADNGIEEFARRAAGL